MEAEADILIDLARMRRAQREPEAAWRLLEEALAITGRSGYVLQGADAHLLKAQLMKEAGEAGWREEARLARDLAACDGPGYRYQVAWEEAGALLAEDSG